MRLPISVSRSITLMTILHATRGQSRSCGAPSYSPTLGKAIPVASVSLGFRRRLDRVDDLLVTGAPAQIAFQPALDRRPVRMGMLREDAGRLDHHARRAEPTLHRPVLAKGTLQPLGARVAGEA